MNRRAIATVSVSAVITIAILVGIINILLSPNPEPISKEEAYYVEPTVTEGVKEGDAYDYETIEPTTIQGKEVTPDEVIDTYVPIAEKAAREYVSQSTAESGEERITRLLKVFHDDSSIIYSTPPNVDKSGSTNTTSKPTILYNEWDIAGDTIITTVYMRVDTIKNNTKEKVSQVYQVYDVVLTEQNGVYKAKNISFSNKPVVIGQ